MKKRTLKYVAVCAIALTAATSTAPAVTTILGQGSAIAEASQADVNEALGSAFATNVVSVEKGKFTPVDATFLGNPSATESGDVTTTDLATTSFAGLIPASFAGTATIGNLVDEHLATGNKLANNQVNKITVESAQKGITTLNNLSAGTTFNVKIRIYQTSASGAEVMAERTIQVKVVETLYSTENVTANAVDEAKVPVIKDQNGVVISPDLGTLKLVSPDKSHLDLTGNILANHSYYQKVGTFKETWEFEVSGVLKQVTRDVTVNDHAQAKPLVSYTYPDSGVTVWAQDGDVLPGMDKLTTTIDKDVTNDFTFKNTLRNQLNSTTTGPAINYLFARPDVYLNYTWNATSTFVKPAFTVDDIDTSGVDYTKVGSYNVFVKVTNNYGFSAKFKIPVVVTETGNKFDFSSAQGGAKDIILQKDEAFDPKKGIQIMKNDGVSPETNPIPDIKDVKVVGSVNTAVPGTYVLEYSWRNSVTSKTVVATRTIIVLGDGQTKPGESVQLYRVYNRNNGEHYFTKDTNERNYLVSIGWDDEGLAWKAPTTGDPIYRAYNPNSGEHYYTTDMNEYNYLGTLGWNLEGVKFYSAKDQSVPVYTVFNKNAKDAGSHHYTTNKNEVNNLVGKGWRQDQTKIYAFGE